MWLLERRNFMCFCNIKIILALSLIWGHANCGARERTELNWIVVAKKAWRARVGIYEFTTGYSRLENVGSEWWKNRKLEKQTKKTARRSTTWREIEHRKELTKSIALFACGYWDFAFFAREGEAAKLNEEEETIVVPCDELCELCGVVLEDEPFPFPFPFEHIIVNSFFLRKRRME